MKKTRFIVATGLVAFRVAGAAAAFLLLLRLRGKLTTPRRGDIARLAVYSLLGVVLLWVYSPRHPTAVVSVWGPVLVLSSAFAWAAGSVLHRHQAMRLT